MPVKRRRTKLRDAAELDAWHMTFSAGADYLGDLADVGLNEGEMSREEFRRAAARAWRRLGSEFMATWKPRPSRNAPWALGEFGQPRRTPCR